MRREGEWRYVLALFALPFILFFRETLGLRVFYVHDLQYYFYPYRKVATDILFSGHLPLWNPYTNCGIPLIGDGQVGLFYPPNWLHLIFNPAHALTLAILSTYSIAGVGMYLFVREILRSIESRWPALIAAVGFMFTGFFVAHLLHVSIPATAAWVPWIFWGVERFNRLRSIGSLISAAVAVTMQVFAGHPQVPIYCGVALGIYWLLIIAQRIIRRFDWRELWPIARIAAVYALGATIAAIQLVPWYELSKLSPRLTKTPFELFASFSFFPPDWMLMLFPYGYGGMSTSRMQSLANIDFGVIIERMPYVGLVAMTLMVIGVCDWNRLRREASGESHRLLALAVIFVVMILISAGATTPVGRVVYSMPLLGSLRGQARAAAIYAFAVSALSAFGVARLMLVRAKRDFIPILAGGALLIAILVSLIIVNARGEEGLGRGAAFATSLKWGNANAYVPLVLSVLIAGAMGWFSLSRRRERRIPLLLIAGVFAIEMFGFALTFNSTTEPAVLAKVPPSVEFLRKDPDPYRVAVFWQSDRLPPAVAQDQLAISWAMAYGIEDVNGFNSLQPRRLVDFLLDPSWADVTYGHLPPYLLVPPYNRTLTLLSVRYALLQKPYSWSIDPSWRPVFEDENVIVLRNPNDVGRAFFADLVLVRDAPLRGLEMVRDMGFDPTRYAVVEGVLGEQQARELSRARTDAKTKLEVKRVSPNEFEIRTNTPSPRLTVINEVFYPGWDAEVKQGDGSWAPLTVYRANYLFRAIVVPAGDSVIRMVYRPTSVKVGTTVTLCAALACVAAVVIERLRAKRAGASR